eukprot:TRINITY_DN22079_c0_g1_i1.p1 TRINITY_DN22079_c0_g1~~TRINITY_DN22079_c0_g1_i1.p1  ORF type:complete len:713 (-),score=87.40 TRINITY_DN22079_c0_g1_i1:221-2359(-)
MAKHLSILSVVLLLPYTTLITVAAVIEPIRFATVFQPATSLNVGLSEAAKSFAMHSPLHIWPCPASYSYGSLEVKISRPLTFHTIGPAADFQILLDAYTRTQALIFTHSPPRAEASSRKNKGIADADVAAVSAADVGSTAFEGPQSLHGKRKNPDHNTGAEKLHTVASLLTEVVVHVESGDETLQLETDESYTLRVPANGSAVTIKASTVYGALYALQTFSQLCSYDWTARAVRILNAPWIIVDAPRFKHRGLLIDTSRHFQPIPFLKQMVDSLSYAKLNVLHWHIVDEQAFPLEVPSFPRLWEGAYSEEERYTTDDVRDLVEYARLRGVKVMAELDVPGHARSWGVGYPELWPSPNCTEPLDVSRESTFELIEGILTDLADLFPYGMLHLGGDEVDTECWNSTPHIREWLAARNMTPHDAYAGFVLRVQEMAVAKGWTPVNWEEPFNEFAEMLNPKSVVHNWIQSGVAPKIVAAGFRCIVSNQDRWYLDHLEVSWDQFYLNEPLEGITEGREAERVLGGEVCMWGETADPSNVMQTIWPRAAAAAERLWSPREFTDRHLADMQLHPESSLFASEPKREEERTPDAHPLPQLGPADQSPVQEKASDWWTHHSKSIKTHLPTSKNLPAPPPPASTKTANMAPDRHYPFVDGGGRRRRRGKQEMVLKGGSAMSQVLERLHHFRCLLHRRGFPTAPVLTPFARMAPSGPGSCYDQ